MTDSDDLRKTLPFNPITPDLPNDLIDRIGIDPQGKTLTRGMMTFAITQAIWLSLAQA